MKTEFGYHIIKVTDRKPAIVRALTDPDVYKEIESALVREQAEVAGAAERRCAGCRSRRRRRSSTRPPRREA